MSVLDVLVIVALVLAIIEEVSARGRGLLPWAVILLCIRLLLP